MASGAAAAALVVGAGEFRSKGLDDASEETALIKRTGATPFHVFANLMAGGLGSSTFALAWGTAGASTLPALGIIGVVLLLNVWTNSILVEAAEQHQEFDLGSLLGKIPGNLGTFAQTLCNTGLWLFSYLAMVGNTMVIADAFDVFPVPETHVQTRRCLSVAVATAFILPLCFLDQRRLSLASIVGMLLKANVLLYTMFAYAQEEEDGTLPVVCHAGLGTGSITLMSTVVNAARMQHYILPVYSELKDRSPQTFSRVLFAVFASLLAFYAGFSVLGYATYGQTVDPNVLRNIPPTPRGRATRWLAGLSVVGVYPMQLSAFLAPIKREWGAGDYNSTTCAVVCLVSVAAVLLSDLGFLSAVCGAVSLGAFVVAIPVLVAVKLLGGGRGWQGLALAAFTALGLSASCLAFLHTENCAAELSASCAWSLEPWVG